MKNLKEIYKDNEFEQPLEKIALNMKKYLKSNVFHNLEKYIFCDLYSSDLDQVDIKTWQITSFSSHRAGRDIYILEEEQEFYNNSEELLKNTLGNITSFHISIGGIEYENDYYGAEEGLYYESASLFKDWATLLYTHLATKLGLKEINFLDLNVHQPNNLQLVDCCDSKFNSIFVKQL